MKHGDGRESDLDKETHRILVVDDDATIRIVLQMGLASQEFAVDVAANGEDGIRLGCTGKYDVLIADLNLPDVDGMQVIRAIKKQHPGVVPIIITGYPTAERLHQGMQIGVKDFLEKPFSLEAIKKAVRQGLEEWKTWACS